MPLIQWSKYGNLRTSTISIKGSEFILAISNQMYTFNIEGSDFLISL